MLVIKNLFKQFGGRNVLDDVSLDVKPGKIAVLLGASGVGKSTLLKILSDLIPFDKGVVMLDDKKFDVSDPKKRHIVGLVSQHFDLFDNLTVLENVTLALEKVVGKSKQNAEKEARHLLSSYGLQDFACRYPQSLSGGQKQRLAIVRTIALKPKIICFDEPTSALDPVLTSSVAKNIEELSSEGYIILVATHDTLLIEKLPCTIHLMQSGKIVESAQSKDLWQDRNKYPSIDAFVAGRS